jgi:hypothetical protein
MSRKSRRAPRPTPEQLEALYAARKKGNPARRPTPEQLEALYAARRANKNSAEPGGRGEGPPLGVMKTYRCTGDRICHGKKKGELVDLWDNGATRALVQAGHLVEVVEEENDHGRSADIDKEADNG